MTNFELTQVAQAHDDTPNLELKPVGWNSRLVDGVQEFHIETLTILWIAEGVERRVDSALTGHLVQKGRIDSVYNGVGGGKNCPLFQPLDVAVVTGQIRVHCLHQLVQVWHAGAEVLLELNVSVIRHVGDVAVSNLEELGSKSSRADVSSEQSSHVLAKSQDLTKTTVST